MGRNVACINNRTPHPNWTRKNVYFLKYDINDHHILRNCQMPNAKIQMSNQNTIAPPPVDTGIGDKIVSVKLINASNRATV